jgi:hypothetical protein
VRPFLTHGARIWTNELALAVLDHLAVGDYDLVALGLQVVGDVPAPDSPTRKFTIKSPPPKVGVLAPRPPKAAGRRRPKARGRAAAGRRPARRLLVFSFERSRLSAVLSLSRSTIGEILSISVICLDLEEL